MNKQRVIPALCFLFMAVSLCAAAEEWFEAYDEAMNDIKTQNWLLAETRLNAAIRQHPEQGRKVRAYGARYMRYFPEYYLGVVYFHTAKYQNALERFLSVQNKGLISETDGEFKEMTNLTQQAMVKLSPQIKPSANAPTVPATTISESNTAEKQPPAQENQPVSNETAHNPPEVAQSVQPGPTPPQDEKQQPSTLSDEGIEGEPQYGKIEIAAAITEIRKQMKAKNWSNAEKAAAVLQQLDPSNSEFRRITLWLDQRKAVIAFYSGEFDTSIQLFRKVSAAEKPDATTHFYMGCSLAALGFFQGVRGKPLLEKARQEFVASRRLQPNMDYDRQFISPRILKLYEQSN